MIPVKGKQDAGYRNQNANGKIRQVKRSVCEDVCALCIAKGRDVFQTCHRFGQVGDDVEKIKQSRYAKTGAGADAAACGYAKADGCDLDLQHKISEEQKGKHRPVRRCVNALDGQKRNGKDGGMKQSNLQQHGAVFLRNNAAAGNGMRKQKFGGMLPFFFRQGRDAGERGKKCAAKSEDVAAFDAKVSHKFAKVQLVHAKCSGKAAHIGEHITNILHLLFHVRINKNAQGHQARNYCRPDEKRLLSKRKFMSDKRHVRGSPLHNNA